MDVPLLFHSSAVSTADYICSLTIVSGDVSSGSGLGFKYGSGSTSYGIVVVSRSCPSWSPLVVVANAVSKPMVAVMDFLFCRNMSSETSVAGAKSVLERLVLLRTISVNW